MKKGIFHSILLRYIISYAIVMAVLFIGVGIYVSGSFSATIHQNIVEENTNRLSSVRKQHEEKLTALLNIGNQIAFSPYISSFKLSEQPLKAFHLKQQMMSYSASDTFFEQLYLIFHEDEYLYSALTSVSLAMYSEKLMRYEHVSAQTLRELLRGDSGEVVILPSQNTQSALTSGTNKQMITVLLPLRLEGRFSYGNALFLIPDSAYQQMFADEIDQQRSMYIYYADQVLAAGHPLAGGENAVREAIAGQKDAFFTDLSIQGTDYMLFMQPGSMLSMRYVSLIPKETVHTQTARSRLTLGLFLLFMSVPCSLLTVYFARKHVRPIKELQKSMGVGAAGGDGFSAIRIGIESLRGQNEALHNRLDESRGAIEAEFIKNFIKSRYAQREAAVSAAAKLAINVDRTYYCAALVAAVPQEAGGMERLYRLAADHPQVSGCGMEIVDQEQHLFVLFADTREALEEWAEQARLVLGDMDREAVVAVSGIHKDFAKAASAYLEVGTAYDNRFVMGSEHVLWFSDVRAAAKDVETFSRGYLDGFRKALHAGNASALNDRIDELFEILNVRKFSLFSFRVIYNDIIGMLLNKYFSYEDVPGDALQYYDIFELSRCRRVDDLIAILRQLCDDILAKEDQEKPQGHSCIAQVTAYMHEHYTNPDLTIGAIADHYGLSAARLSLEYREQTGMNASDYLLVLRMEKAKELLAQTDQSVKDVGIAVGYYDASGFIRRFKRHMGVTPAQYRQTRRAAVDSGGEGVDG